MIFTLVDFSFFEKNVFREDQVKQRLGHPEDTDQTSHHLSPPSPHIHTYTHTHTEKEKEAPPLRSHPPTQQHPPKRITKTQVPGPGHMNTLKSRDAPRSQTRRQEQNQQNQQVKRESRARRRRTVLHHHSSSCQRQTFRPSSRTTSICSTVWKSSGTNRVPHRIHGTQ